MFSWYRDSAVCYAYLSDVLADGSPQGLSYKNLWRSRWFSRGWTLQELVAPDSLVFYDAWWRLLGSRNEIADLISEVTRIDPTLLQGYRPIQSFSIAQKMSWAAHRETTRVEDRAYSLLGIFNIHIPLAYGEGWKAFGRLQTEILRITTDQSIFAWTLSGPIRPTKFLTPGKGDEWAVDHKCSILAPTPDCFLRSSSIISGTTCGNNDHTHPLLASYMSGVSLEVTRALNRPMAVTNTGLQITLLVQRIIKDGGQCLLEAILNCCYDHDKQKKISIFLVAETDAPWHDSDIDSIPAWRVEPYLLGSVRWREPRTKLSRNLCAFDDRKEKSWSAVPLGIHPVYPAELESLHKFENSERIEEEYAARERIRDAKKAAKVLRVRSEIAGHSVSAANSRDIAMFLGVGLALFSFVKSKSR